MSAHRWRSRLIAAAIVAALGWPSIALLGPSAGAQADPSNNASINLVNRSGANTHMWLGHSDAPRAWIIPGGSGLWWMTLQGDRDFPGGPWNYNDKVRVNALTVGQSKDKTVTQEFPIRGHATNMSATWDGGRIIFQASYPPSEGGARGATGDGAGGVMDLTPEEITEALNAAIIAIIIGILVSGLGAAAATTAVPDGDGLGSSVPEPTSGPMDSGLRDPDSGEPVWGWEAGKYDPASGGQPGDVWYDGRWQPAAEAAAQIQATHARQAAQQAFNERQLNDSRERNRQLDAEAHARQQRADAAAGAELQRLNQDLKQARDEARKTLREAIKQNIAVNEERAERMKANALTLQRLTATAGAVQTIADTGMDVVSNYCGTPGKFGNVTYKFVKGFVGKVAEGQSYRDAAKQGAAEAAVEALGGLIQGKLGGELKIPDLHKTAVNSDLYTRVTITAGGEVQKRFRSWTGRGIVNTITGEVCEKPVDAAMKRMGWKQPDE